MAAIIFISIGVIASFFCAIVDGIIASEFIVSITCAEETETQTNLSFSVWTNLDSAHSHTRFNHTGQQRQGGFGYRNACQVRNFVDVISQNYQSHHDSRQIDQTNWSQCLPCGDGETFDIAGLINCVQTLLWTLLKTFVSCKQIKTKQYATTNFFF